MKYFVSVEPNDYSLWQIELLIQSFKMRQKEKDLVIAVADPADGVSSDTYKRNLLAHENKFFHYNIGKENKYPKLNKLYGLACVHKEGLLGDKFAVLHPDMLLYQNVRLEVMLLDSLNILFQPKTEDKNDVFVKVKKDIENDQKQWLPMGDVIVFNKMPENFFIKAYQTMEELIAEHGTDWDAEPATWSLTYTTHRMGGHPITLSGAQLEMSLMNFLPNPFVVHYKNGLPPNFSKRIFKQMPPIVSLAAHSDPIQVILNEASKTVAMDYLQEVCMAYVSGK
jgi:hypothetical protein